MPNDPAVFFHLQMTVIPQPPPDGSISPELYQLFLRMIAVDPRARYQSAKEFAIAFASLVSPMPEAGLPSGAQIVERFARDFLRGSAALDATLRSNPDHSGAAPIVFPLRGTRPVPGDSAPTPAPASGTPQPMPVVNAPGSAPTVSARPAGPGHVPHDTTLGSASGMMRSQAPQARRGGAAVALVGIGVALAAAAGVFFVARAHRHTSDVASAANAPLDALVVHDSAAVVATGAAAPAPVTSAPVPAAGSRSASAGSAAPIAANVPAPTAPTEPSSAPAAPVEHAAHAVTPEHVAPAMPHAEHAEHAEHHAAPAVKGTGTLIVTFAGDSWASCYVDSKKIGSTPCHATLSAGAHRLRVVTITPTKHEDTQTVTITPNRQTVINETW